MSRKVGSEVIKHVTVRLTPYLELKSICGVPYSQGTNSETGGTGKVRCFGLDDAGICITASMGMPGSH
jgi:hypothetical protein